MARRSPLLRRRAEDILGNALDADQVVSGVLREATMAELRDRRGRALMEAVLEACSLALGMPANDVQAGDDDEACTLSVDAYVRRALRGAWPANDNGGEMECDDDAEGEGDASSVECAEEEDAEEG